MARESSSNQLPSVSVSPSRASAVSSQGGRRPTGDDAAGGSPLPRRWSARRKAEIVLRLMRGESLDALAREINQPASRISEWRDAFLTGGEQAMKARGDDPAQEAVVEDRRRLEAKIGKQAMEIELLYERCHTLEAGLPPAQRRSRR